MLLEIFLLAIGLLVLVKSSDIVIDKAIELSQLTGISNLTIGFIFLAVATSLPEFAVTVMSGLEGEGILGIATLFGANISDLAFVFGLMTLFSSFIIVGKDFHRIVHAVLITSVIALFALALGTIGFTFGIFALFIFYLFSASIVKEGFPIGGKEAPRLITLRVVNCILIIIAGITILIVSAKIVTDAAIAVANFFNVYESLIGATILPIGTTLPEAAVCIAAIKKLNIELAVGNIIGSLVANLALILGAGALISVIVFDPIVKVSIIFLLLTNIVFLALARKEKFGLTQGAILFIIYFTYLATIFFIGTM
jgi:cation:H+ antiporter